MGGAEFYDTHGLADRWVSANLTGAERAAAVRVNLRTLQSWRSRGEGPPWTKLGRKKILYRISDVLVYEKENMRRSTVDDGANEEDEEDELLK